MATGVRLLRPGSPGLLPARGPALGTHSSAHLGVEEPAAAARASRWRAAVGRISYRLDEAVRRPVFWSIAGAQGLLYLAQLSFLIIHAVPFLALRGGFRRAELRPWRQPSPPYTRC